ncbi:MAG: FHA domain-containing protein [Thermodesulfobacteriota bacterium]|nr:FHA domain-containing protein [Thermodesulfobacteriota bacterium]
MMHPATIAVQLVHIQGPLKGEIQELCDPVIRIGRHPSCHVQFPKDMAIISRKHAEIRREGNRFRLVDSSTNGTFVNGKRVDEAFLKDGDVLTFAEGGPKLSFLTKTLESRPEPASVPEHFPSGEQVIHQAEKPHVSKVQTRPDKVREISSQKAQVRLVIQYGPTLRSFNELPITIGKDPSCQCVLDHPAVHDQHVQILFSQGNYWAKDLTGKDLLSINKQPIQLQTPLNPNDLLELSPQGPAFRFLGEGRLAEVDVTVDQQLGSPPRNEEEVPQQGKPMAKEPKQSEPIFKKFFRR